jgi:hypothetical protein
MRFLYLLLFAILFGACSQDEGDSQLPVTNPTKQAKLYGVKPIDESSTRAIGVLNKFWHTATPITIKFLDGTPAMQEVVKTYAAEWLKYANLSFNYVGASEEADVRITFGMNNSRYVTWSAIGTDCKRITNQNEATMNFAFFNESTATEQKGDVLRAFGQMLGLELEHRHLALSPTWGSNIQNYWTQDITDIDWQTLQKYVITPLSAANTVSTQEYDPASIMIWPFVGRGLVTYNAGYTVPTNFNSELSTMDKAFILNTYPGKEEAASFEVTRNWFGSGPYVYFYLVASKEMFVDLGNGTGVQLTSADLNKPIKIMPKYAEVKNYTLKIFGDASAITSLSIFADAAYPSYTGARLANIDVSKCVNLEYFTLNLGYLFEDIDLSKNTKLKELNFQPNGDREVFKLRVLDLTNNINLTKLILYKTDLEGLGIKECVNLEYVDISRTPLLDTYVFSHVSSSLPSRVGRIGGVFKSGRLLDQYVLDELKSKNWVNQ